MSHKTNQDAKNIGARFRSARSLVPDLNRKSFCERYGINRYTMQSWENGLHVSKGKNVEKFIESLAREGVYCTSEWLIEGIGEPARPLASHNHKPSSEVPNIEKVAVPDQSVDRILKVLIDAYAESGDQVISHRLADDALAPKFLRGDLVLGRRLDHDTSLAHQKFCLIELNPERMIARKILVTKEGLLLVALDERVQTLLLNHQSVVYEIIWHQLVS